MAFQRNKKKKRRGRTPRMKRASILTTDKTLVVDYKNTDLLRKFISPEGKILSQRITRCTAKQQREVCQAIKRARHIALLPFENKDR